MLLANNITFSRNNREVLKNINVSLKPNKIIHLKGNNGVGKTTLLKIITNVIKPDQGDIFWNGKNIKKNPYELYKNLTFIMDKRTSNNFFTVYENILFWKNLFRSKINNKEIDSVLSMLLLDKYKNINASNLSYGELKKLELSRLIIEKKMLWVLDEPYIGLDSPSADLLNQTFLNHIELGGIIIFTSHITPAIRTLHSLNLETENER